MQSVYHGDGISSVFGFKMELTPEMEMPMLFALTIYQGGDPETTQELVTKVVEDSGKTLAGVDSIDALCSCVLRIPGMSI